MGGIASLAGEWVEGAIYPWMEITVRELSLHVKQGSAGGENEV